MNQELILKAKEASSAEELMALAKENGMEMNEEQAQAYFDVTHKTGELADDELDSVAGGWCYNDGRPVITVGEQHDCFFCAACGKSQENSCDIIGLDFHSCTNGRTTPNCCGECTYCRYERALWLCYKPENKK